MSHPMPTALSHATGLRASDPRVLLDPDIWWTTAYCTTCRRLCWIREAEYAVGREVRCTVCLGGDAINDIETDDEQLRDGATA